MALSAQPLLQVRSLGRGIFLSQNITGDPAGQLSFFIWSLSFKRCLNRLSSVPVEIIRSLSWDPHTSWLKLSVSSQKMRFYAFRIVVNYEFHLFIFISAL